MCISLTFHLDPDLDADNCRVHEIKSKVFLIIFINTPFFLITIYVQDTKQIKSTLSLISVVGTQ